MSRSAPEPALPPPSSVSPGEQVRAAITGILRWGSRSDVRRSLAGSSVGDVSSTELWLLGAVTDSGPVRVTDLADWQGVDKSTVTPQVRRLQERGLVSRRPDPEDRRASLLSATEEGSRVLRESYAAGAAVFDDILSDWSEPDRAALAAMFMRLSEELAYQFDRRTQVSGQ